MGSESATRGLSARAVAVDVLISLFVSALVYVDFWGGRLPEASPVGAALGLAAGAAVGAGVVYADTRTDLRERFANAATFVVALAVAVAIGLLFFSEGLPVPVEIGLVGFVWASVAARAFLGWRAGVF